MTWSPNSPLYAGIAISIFLVFLSSLPPPGLLIHLPMSQFSPLLSLKFLFVRIYIRLFDLPLCLAMDTTMTKFPINLQNKYNHLLSQSPFGPLHQCGGWLKRRAQLPLTSFTLGSAPLRALNAFQ